MRFRFGTRERGYLDSFRENAQRKRSAAGAVVTLSLAHPDFKELERKLRTIILGKAMACVLDLNLALRSAEAKRFGAVVEDIENQVLRFWNNAAKAKSLSPDKKTKMGWLEIALSKARAEVASKARELDSSRSTMNGLRVKMGVLENKLREAESRDVEDGRTASSVEARSTEELAGELGRLTRMVWGIEEEKERGGQLRMKLEDKCTSLRSELEQVRREFEAKSASCSASCVDCVFEVLLTSSRRRNNRQPLFAQRRESASTPQHRVRRRTSRRAGQGPQRCPVANVVGEQ